jgi:hypothetical protein
MTGVSLALIGLGTILTASTLVWMISVRLEDASIADRPARTASYRGR